MSDFQGLSALGRSLGVQQELSDLIGPKKPAEKAGHSVAEEKESEKEKISPILRFVQNETKPPDKMGNPAPENFPSFEKNSALIEKNLPVPDTSVPILGKDFSSLDKGLSLVENEILGKTGQVLAASDAKKNADPTELAQIHSSKELAELLDPESRTRLNLFRFELASIDDKFERERKEGELREFIKSKLAKPVSEETYKELFTSISVKDLHTVLFSTQKSEAEALLKLTRETIGARADLAIKNEAKLKQFKDSMQAFEKRCTEQGLPQTEVLDTYLQLGRILNPGTNLIHGNAGLLARSLIQNAADPTSIDQGGHNTCNVNTLECRLYTQEPSTVADLIADVAINGTFKTADGTIIRPGEQTPDLEARFDPTPDGLRDYASQIFQRTAINVHWNRKDTLPGGKMVGKGNIQYRQGKPGEPAEYLLNTSVTPSEIHKFRSLDSSHPWLDLDGLTDINAQITGKPSVNFGIQRWIYPSDSNGVAKVVTFGGFKEKLDEYKRQNSFPVIVAVDGGKKPFGSGDGGFGPHVVTLTDYDPSTGKVTLDNQWGKENDLTDLPGQKAKVTDRELFDSMNMLPSGSYLWEHLVKNVKDIKQNDVLPPTAAALSSKVLRYGVFGSAPLAVKGGLGALSEWGVPGAGSLLTAAETRAGSVMLRAGTGLGAFSVFALTNDLPGAFKEGNSRGAGRLTRVLLDTCGFDLGSQLTSKAAAVIGLKWAPARLGLMLAAGTVTATILDRALGDGAEIAGSEVYEIGREYFSGQEQIPKRKRVEEKGSMDGKLDLDQAHRIEWKKPSNIMSGFNPRPIHTDLRVLR